MDFLFAILSGIIEGITEFLPVSSTAHLVILGAYFDYPEQKKEAYYMVVQLAAILAVMIIFKEKIYRLFDFKTKENFYGINGWLYIFAATMPILCLGFLLKDVIKPYKPSVAIAALICGAIVMLLVEKYKPASQKEEMEQITLKDAFFIGLAQSLSLWYGMSRSAMTICGGMLLGLNRKVAAEFSFLAAIPVMFVVAGYECYKMTKISESIDFTANDFWVFGIGCAVSFVTSYLVVKWFIAFVSKFSLNAFAIYRLLSAPIVGYFLYYYM